MKLLIAFILILVCATGIQAQVDSTELLPVKVNGLWGYANIWGGIVIQPQYQAAESFNGNNFAKVKLNGKAVLISKVGHATEYPADVNIKVLKGNYLIIEQNGKWGVTDESLTNIILPAKFSTIKYFDNTDNQIIPWRPKQLADEFVLATENDSLWGLYNFEGKEILPQKYTYIQLTKGYFYASTNERQGVYSYTGKQILPVQFGDITRFSASHFAAKLNGLWGLYDTLGNVFFEPVWAQVRFINDAWGVFESADSTTLINLNNKKYITDSLYDMYVRHGTSYLMLLKQNKRGLYNEVGKELLPIQFDDFYLSGNYYYTKNNKLVGLYDTDGNQIVPPTYNFVDAVQDNVALVRLGKYWGLINTKGQEVIPTKYTDIDLGAGTAKCTATDGLEIYTLNTKGEITDVVKYGNVITLDINGSGMPNSRRNTQNINVNNNFPFRMGNWFYDTALKKWGLYNQRGDTIIPPTYSHVNRTDTSKYAIVQVGETKYSVTIAGFSVLFNGRKGLVRESDGKIIAKPSLAFIDPIVLQSKGFVYARALLLSGQYLVITPEGSIPISGCRFIDEQHEGISRAFIGEVGNKPYNSPDSMSISASKYISELHGTVDLKKSIAAYLRNLDFKKGYWIYIDTRGRRVNAKYSYAYNFFKNRAIVMYDKYYGVINNTFGYVLEPKYNYISHLPYSNYSRFLVQTFVPKVGYIDTLGNPITGFNFEKANNFSCGYGLVLITKDNGKVRQYRYVDENGDYINDDIYTRANDFAEDLALVRVGSSYTHINQYGITVTGEYRKAGSFSGGRSWIIEKGKHIIIDDNGKKYTANQFAKITPFAQNRATAIIKNGKWEVIDTEGNTVGSTKYNRTKNFDSLGNCIVAKKRKWGIINQNNHPIIPFKYKNIEGPVAGIYILRKSGPHYYIFDANHPENKIMKLGKAANLKVLAGGQVVFQKGKNMYVFANGIKTQFCNTAIPQKYIFDDFCIVGSGNKMGVINYQGDTLLPTNHRLLRYCGNGLFFYYTDSKTPVGSLITLDGKVVLKNIQAIHNFSNGIAPAQKNDKWGIVDVNGIWITEPKYNWVDNYHNNFARARTNNSMKIADANGNFIIDANFDKIEYNQSAQLYRVELGKKIGYINPQQDWVWQPTQ
jgi:hypothetical protein